MVNHTNISKWRVRATNSARLVVCIREFDFEWDAHEFAEQKLNEGFSLCEIAKPGLDLPAQIVWE